MKTLKSKKVIILLVVLAVIIAGIVVGLLKGINFSLKFKGGQSLGIYFDNSISKEDVLESAKLVFPDKKIIVQNISKSESEVLITVNVDEITEENKNALVEKINEKYEGELSVDEIELISNGKASIIDIVRPYILPMLITLVIIVAYFMIRYKRIGIQEIILDLVKGILLPELLYLSIIVISRIAVDVWLMPIAITIYLASLICLMHNFDKKYEKIPVKKNKKTK